MKICKVEEQINFEMQEESKAVVKHEKQLHHRFISLVNILYLLIFNQ